jgi:hypothetical protein
VRSLYLHRTSTTQSVLTYMYTNGTVGLINKGVTTLLIAYTALKFISVEKNMWQRNVNNEMFQKSQRKLNE